MLLEFRHVDTHYGDLHVLKDVNYAIESVRLSLCSAAMHRANPPR